MSKPYQVFVGCPFSREIRSAYDRLKKEVEAATPLSIVLADTVGVSSSDYLLEHITELIRDSAGCVFDATGANLCAAARNSCELGGLKSVVKDGLASDENQAST